MSTKTDFFRSLVKNVPVGDKFATVIKTLDETGRSAFSDTLEDLKLTSCDLDLMQEGLKPVPKRKVDRLVQQYGVNAAFIYTNDDQQPILF